MGNLRYSVFRGIPTVGNLTEINLTSETRKFRGNVMEILTEISTEMLNRNSTGNSGINGITGNNLIENFEKKWKFRSKPRKFRSK